MSKTLLWEKAKYAEVMQTLASANEALGSVDELETLNYGAMLVGSIDWGFTLVRTHNIRKPSRSIKIPLLRQPRISLLHCCQWPALPF